MSISNARAAHSTVALLLSISLASPLAAQTRVTPPSNKYTPAQDVQIGRDAAKQVEQQMPILRDDLATSYVRTVGERLVAAIPPDLRQPEFQYTFQVVDVSDINAFALPGGPMFVNRGMMQAAHTEGEIAGVMAHELSHVVLRHGTAQASKATKYEVGQVAGAVLGAIVGGALGSVIAQGTQFGLGAAFMRFSREFEKEADIEGSHIMAHAGYDPRDMANMFKTIEQQGGPSGPTWLSDHPNPGDRYTYINAEARSLQVDNPVRNTEMFDRVEAHLRSLPPAMTSEEVARRGANSGRRPVNAPLGRVEPPSSRYQTYTEGDVFRVSVPSNWRELSGSNAVTFAPEGAYGQQNGSSMFTHGVQIGLARNVARDLQTATDELLSSLGRGNPGLRRASRGDAADVAGRRGMRTMLTNVSEGNGGQETLEIFTTFAGNGELLYVIGVAPSREFRDYEDVFGRVVSSIQLFD